MRRLSIPVVSNAFSSDAKKAGTLGGTWALKPKALGALGDANRSAVSLGLGRLLLCFALADHGVICHACHGRNLKSLGRHFGERRGGYIFLTGRLMFLWWLVVAKISDIAPHLSLGTQLRKSGLCAFDLLVTHT